MDVQPIIQVDAFTDTPFAGNPAAVCVMPKMADPDWMQAVAAEMNLAETAFVTPHEDPFKRAWHLRWFTSTIEVSLCGHATLASAHTLWTEGYLRPDEAAKFDTLSGRLTCTRDTSGWITMDFPALKYEACDMPAGLAEALGITDGRCFRNVYEPNYYRYVVLLDDAAQVRAIKPDMSKLTAIDTARATIVTAASP